MAIFALREPKGHVDASASKRTVITTIKPSPTSVAKSSPTTRAASTSTAKKTSSSATSSSRTTSVQSVPLVVLNNTTTQGLARQAAGRFETGGWTVTRYANYTNNILSTCAYYDPAASGAKAAALALREQYPAIKRVQPKFAELPSGPVVVVLTPDYSSG